MTDDEGGCIGSKIDKTNDDIEISVIVTDL